MLGVKYRAFGSKDGSNLKLLI